MPVTQYERGVGLHGMGLYSGDAGYGQAGLTFQTGLTALAGGAQAGSPLLSKSINVVTVCATDADSAQLPPAYGGQAVYVANTSGHALQVFANASGTDTINATAGSTGVSIASHGNAVFFSISAAWRMILSA